MPNSIYDKISSLICFSNYDNDQIDEMLDYLRNLRDNSLFLDALINSGVNNWEWYDDAVDLYNEYKEAESDEGN